MQKKVTKKHTHIGDLKIEAVYLDNHLLKYTVESPKGVLPLLITPETKSLYATIDLISLLYNKKDLIRLKEEIERTIQIMEHAENEVKHIDELLSKGTDFI